MRDYWVLANGHPRGPYAMGQVIQMLDAGEITTETLICVVGGSQWHPVRKVIPPPPPLRQGERIETIKVAPLQFDHTDRASPMLRNAAAKPEPPFMPAPDSPVPLNISLAAAEPGLTNSTRAWNPVTILLLGLLFSPVWSGIMACINGARLRMNMSGGVPVLIGIGSLVASLLISSTAWESVWIDVAIYLGAIFLLWVFVLSPQDKEYRRCRFVQEGLSASWTWPVVAGCPLALLVVCTFLISPFLPLEPRQVCERFVQIYNANSLKEMARYTTLRMQPALEALILSKQQGANPVHFELLEEGPGPPNLGGYLVAYRSLTKDGAMHIQGEGLFHLIQAGSEWKIEEMFLTSSNNQPIDPWIAVSRDFRLFLANAPPPPPRVNQGPNGFHPKDESQAKKTTQIKWYDARLWMGLGLFISWIVGQI